MLIGKFLFDVSNNNWFHIVGLGATLNVAKPHKGSSVAIFGLGAVGLAVSSFATRVNFGSIYSCNKKKIVFFFSMFRPLRELDLLVLQGLLGLT